MLILNKTAPCLLRDLLDYDPCHEDRPQRKSCQHVYATKYERSSLPELDERPESRSQWYVFCVCQQCRCRLELIMHFQDAPQPCPTAGWPLHHFNKLDMENGYTNFECSAEGCRAVLSARVLPPVLNDHDVRYLTDSAQIRARYEGVLQTDRALEEPSVVRCLSNFRRYVADALQNETDRRIPAHNKNFMVVLGEGARNLLQRIGFRYAVTEPGTAAWFLPRNVQHSNGPEKYLLEDLREELTILIQQRPESERRDLNDPEFPPPPGSVKDLERTLGTLDYDKALVSRRPPPLPKEVGLAYAGLGACPDFSDGLVSFAFDRQAATDPKHTANYFGYLKVVASYRQSDVLETKALTLVSQGYYSTADLEQAYRSLNIDIKHVQLDLVSDDHILSQYRARISDVGLEEQRTMKESLGIIARDRQSAKLHNLITMDTDLSTYEQALEYLGATDDVPDETIGLLMTVRHNENKSERNSENLALKAAEIIAEHRNSEELRRAIRRHNLQENSTMDVSTAYDMLGIQDYHVDDEQVSEVWQIRRTDNTENTDTYDQALGAIAQARSSTRLFEQLRTVEEQYKVQPKPKALAITEPRGLKNIGNTCYLNSLLQYFFTIKPVRELVHNFNEHAQNTQSESLSSKRVGDMPVKKEQVERAQQFVAELDKLFQTMITTRSQYTAPAKELARLTLVNVVNETVQKNVRRSTITSPRPVEIDLTKEEDEAGRSLPKDILPNTEQASDVRMTENQEDPSSEATTLNGDNPIDKDIIDEPEPMIDEETEKDENAVVNSQDKMDIESVTPVPPAKIGKTPPELPPRPSKVEPPAKDEYEAYAQQQDVREVIENVLYQLRWAMKGDMITDKADQVDLISKLFFGRENTILEEEGKKSETKPTPFYEMNLILSKPTDIYSAIDESLGRSDVEKTGRYQFQTVEALPDVLQFSVNRIVFSKEESKAVRVNHQLKLKRTICMDRYMAKNERMLALRREQWGYMKQLKILQDKEQALKQTPTDTTVPETLSLVRDYLRELASDAADVDFDSSLVTTELMDGLEKIADDARKEMSDITSRVRGLETELHHLFDEEDRTCVTEYALHAVFVHRGGATSGHWVIFIKDPETDVWRQFNDEEVTQVEEKSVLEPDSVNVGSSFIVYVRKDKVGDIVEAVNRQPEEAPPRDIYSDFLDCRASPSSSDTGSELNQAPSGQSPTMMWALGHLRDLLHDLKFQFGHDDVNIRRLVRQSLNHFTNFERLVYPRFSYNRTLFEILRSIIQSIQRGKTYFDARDKELEDIKQVMDSLAATPDKPTWEDFLRRGEWCCSQLDLWMFIVMTATSAVFCALSNFIRTGDTSSKDLSVLLSDLDERLDTGFIALDGQNGLEAIRLNWNKAVGVLGRQLGMDPEWDDDVEDTFKNWKGKGGASPPPLPSYAEAIIMTSRPASPSKRQASDSEPEDSDKTPTKKTKPENSSRFEEGRRNWDPFAEWLERR